jgi:hypothetical protein
VSVSRAHATGEQHGENDEQARARTRERQQSRGSN